MKSWVSVPSNGTMALKPQSAPSSTASMRTSSMSPGSAPSIATGPVRRWPKRMGRSAAWIAFSEGETVMPLPSGGSRPGGPVSVSITTRSPDLIVSTGGVAAAKRPQSTVSGVAFNRWSGMMVLDGMGKRTIGACKSRTAQGADPAFFASVRSPHFMPSSFSPSGSRKNTA